MRQGTHRTILSIKHDSHVRKCGSNVVKISAVYRRAMKSVQDEETEERIESKAWLK